MASSNSNLSSGFEPTLLRAGDSVIIPGTYEKALIMKVNREKRAYLVKYINHHGTTMIKQYHYSDVLTETEYNAVQLRHNRMALYLKAEREDAEAEAKVNSQTDRNSDPQSQDLPDSGSQGE